MRTGTPGVVRMDSRNMSVSHVSRASRRRQPMKSTSRFPASSSNAVKPAFPSVIMLSASHARSVGVLLPVLELLLPQALDRLDIRHSGIVHRSFVASAFTAGVVAGGEIGIPAGRDPGLRGGQRLPSTHLAVDHRAALVDPAVA